MHNETLQRSWACDWPTESSRGNSVPVLRLGPKRACVFPLLGEKARTRLLEECEKLKDKSLATC